MFVQSVKHFVSVCYWTISKACAYGQLLFRKQTIKFTGISAGLSCKYSWCQISLTLILVGTEHPARRSFHLEKLWSSARLPFLCQIGLLKIGYKRVFLSWKCFQTSYCLSLLPVLLWDKKIKLIWIFSVWKTHNKKCRGREKEAWTGVQCCRSPVFEEQLPGCCWLCSHCLWFWLENPLCLQGNLSQKNLMKTNSVPWGTEQPVWTLLSGDFQASFSSGLIGFADSVEPRWVSVVVSFGQVIELSWRK